MADPTEQDTPPRLLLWALTLGLSGVVAGVFGPRILDPQAGQSVFVGLVITGPIALSFGLLLGKLVQRSGLAPRLQWQGLLGCAGALALATLYLCLAA